MFVARRTLLPLLLITCCVGLASLSAQAQEKKKKKGNDQPQVPRAVTQLEEQLSKLDLSDDQKAKIKDVLKEHTPKVAAAQRKASEALTPEQRRARVDAAAKAKGEGKKGQELAQAVAAAINLTAEQKEKSAAADKEQREIIAAMRAAVSAHLTPEQKAKLQPGNAKKKKQAK